uniref:hypothetical protein n=1 Tax=Agathobacter rectalis TaxID=39491 RepID=UPI004026A73A
MKNYENRLRAIEKIADGKTAKVAFLDYKNGKYYQDGKEIDISTIRANVIIVDDIPDSPPEFLEKGDDMKNESDG